MKNKHYWMLLLLLLNACTSAVKNKNALTSDEVMSSAKHTTLPPITSPGNQNFIVQNETDLIGFWVGMFEPDTSYTDAYVSANEFYWDRANKINICIDKIENGKVSGHSIVAGNDRPFTGEVTLANNVFHFLLKEPGDDKHDGSFHFGISKNDSVINGTWQAYKELKIAKRIYQIQKRIFKYNPDQQLDMEQVSYVDWNKNKTNKISDEDAEDYDKSYFTTTDELSKYNASAQKLTSKQVANMTKADLFILRNSIYARHGYSFKNQQLHAYFDRQPWYIPASVNVKEYLTEMEKQNISLLLRYEKNAKEYYDVFGRG